MIKREILQDVKVNDIKEYENNPRKNDEAVSYVINSIKEFGYGNPIIVDENMEIIAGHTRIKAIKKLGWEVLPEVVKIIGLSDKKKKAYRIADNSTGIKSGWDIGKLEIEMQELDYDMSEFGLDIKFDDVELETEPEERPLDTDNFVEFKLRLPEQIVLQLNEQIDRFKRVLHPEEKDISKVSYVMAVEAICQVLHQTPDNHILGE